MGYLNPKPEQSNIFFKLMEERHGRKATITTNLEYDQWYESLGKKEMVGALLDRLRHRCHTIRIDGPSLRAPEKWAAGHPDSSETPLAMPTGSPFHPSLPSIFFSRYPTLRAPAHLRKKTSIRTGTHTRSLLKSAGGSVLVSVEP